MKKLKLDKGKRALVIVAHPDDETIWMGGVILRNPEVNWTIFSLCRASDKDREPKFKKVCEHYGAECLIFDLDDKGRLGDREAILEAEKLIIKKIGNKKFDYIFTHGRNGEYGHPVHVQTHIAVNNLFRKKLLKGKNIFYFNYKKEDKNIISGKNPDFIINLSKEEFFEKKRIVSKMYGYPTDGIDVGYCTNPETFKAKLVS